MESKSGEVETKVLIYIIRLCNYSIEKLNIESDSAVQIILT